MQDMLKSVYKTFLNEQFELKSEITFPKMALCFGVALLMGLLISFVCAKCATRCSRGFCTSLVIIPSAICAIILLVSGNLGMGIAVLGTFSLVRFRSAQGSAHEITSILISVAVGLACGAGYLFIAVFVAVLLCAVMVVLHLCGYAKAVADRHDLRITVPESMNYYGIFDEIFAKYTKSAVLVKTKTTAMGSLYELTYEVVLKNKGEQKEMIDDIRVRNGNLPVVLSLQKSEEAI